MKQIIAERAGGPEVLRMVEEEIPEPGQSEVRVKVLVAGVAFGDLLWMSGVVPGGPKPPFSPGYDFVGVVDKLGAGTVGLELGQRVAALVRTGGYAEYSCWPAEALTPLNDDLDPAQQICLTLNYVTAYALVTRIGKLETGGRVLVHGAGGGMGTAMLDLCRMMGIQTFGTASRGKHELVESLGGIPIDYKSEDFVEVVKRDGGVDLVVDHIGGSHLARSFKCLRPGGTLVSTSSYAAALGKSGTLETVGGLLRIQLWNLWPNGRSAQLFDVTPYYKKNPGMYTQDLLLLSDHLAKGQLHPVIDTTFPLEEGRHALEYLRDGKARGKVVLLTEAYKS
ncbi:MAG: zinc-binding dehydrogenase [Chloroflexota bacterium]|nr:MAG: zinc-binding dehydrogenase [Chloroflexota bacterium]